jgi:hypothetical protein
LAASRALALGPVDIEIGAKLGYADGGNADLGANPLGLAVGGRGGEVFSGLYGGIDAMYYTGGTPSPPPCVGTACAAPAVPSFHAFAIGIEVGYGLKLSILTIRPQLGLGNITFTAAFGTPNDPSVGKFFGRPALVGLVALGPAYAGADAGLLVVPGFDGVAPIGKQPPKRLVDVQDVKLNTIKYSKP